MNNSQRKRQTLFLIALATSVSIYLLFGTLPFDRGHNRDFWARLMDAGHFPLFLCLMLTFSVYGKLPLASSTAALAVYAAAVEFGQPFFDRSESIIDFSNGLIGILCGTFIALRLRRQVSRRECLSYVASACAILAIMLLPAYREWGGIAWRNAEFPVLGTFEHDSELRLWHATRNDIRITRDSEISIESAHSLRAESLGNGPPAVLYLAGDRDWSQYSAFAAEVHSARDDFDLHLRIDDDKDTTAFAERFNTKVELRRGWNHIEVPLSAIQNGPKARKLDITKIRRVIFFSTAPLPGEFRVDNVRLIP